MDGFNPVAHHRELVVLYPQHLGDIGAVHVKVKEPDLLPVCRQGIGKVDGDRGLPHPAFPGEDHDDVLYIDICFRRQAGLSLLC